MSSHVFYVGQDYSLLVAHGVTANFLTTSGSVLHIGMPGINSSELFAFKNVTIKCGLIVDQPFLSFLFDVKEVGLFDCPFDARLYKSEELAIPELINDQSRLLIELRVVDTTTHILKALRAVTMPPELTRAFVDAAKEQLTYRTSAAEKLEYHCQFSIQTLIEKTKMYTLGE